MIRRHARRGPAKRTLVWIGLVFAFLVLATSTQAQQTCEAGEFPDVIVGDLHNKLRYGEQGGVTSFSVGTTSCNIGTCWLNWFASGVNHPVIGQNMFRLKDGRFEQIAQAWLKHGFTALQQGVCATPENPCQPSGTGNQLGIYCSDPYSAFLNGDQDGMGPKFEVNAATGQYLWPPTDFSSTGNVLYKRLQVQNVDIDPTLNPGALYYVEGQYVALDDAAAGRMNNNTSYRDIDVFESGGDFDFNLTDSTVREQAAIFAWQDDDPGAKVTAVGIPEDPPGCSVASNSCGQVNVGYKATDNGDGTWHYEFAVHNQTSNRNVGEFTVPLPSIAYATNIGFHDVDYHSGEPYDGTDWVWERNGDFITWRTVEDSAANPDGNAIRWGTLYNFRFDTTVPLGSGNLVIGPFDDPTDTVNVFARVPASCLNGNDNDADTYGACDCNDGDAGSWGQPSQVTDLLLGTDVAGTTFQFTAPSELGGTAQVTTYELIRAEDTFDLTQGTCLPDHTIDIQDPPAGSVWAYVMRAKSGCAVGSHGPIGPSLIDGAEVPRDVFDDCP